MSQSLIRLFRPNHLFKHPSLICRKSTILPGATGSPSTPYWLQIRPLKSAPPPNIDKEEAKKDKERIEYTIKFKSHDMKKAFKEASLNYGPLFIVCHIGISLISVGAFCSFVWLVADPVPYLPESFTRVVGEKMMQMTGEGGKFVIAYAMHKVLFPLRLFVSVGLTKLLSPRVKLLRKKLADKKS